MVHIKAAAAVESFSPTAMPDPISWTWSPGDCAISILPAKKTTILPVHHVHELIWASWLKYTPRQVQSWTPTFFASSVQRATRTFFLASRGPRTYVYAHVSNELSGRLPLQLLLGVAGEEEGETETQKTTWAKALHENGCDNVIIKNQAIRFITCCMLLCCVITSSRACA